MPQFEIHGNGRGTGKARKRVYSAKDEDEAREKAEAEGTIVQSVQRLPDEPPPPRQVEFAKELKLRVPKGSTKEDLSELIAAEILRRNPPADERHFALARSFGLQPRLQDTKKQLFDFIAQELGKPGRERDLCAWFTYRVCRHLVSGGEDHPEAASPQVSAVLEIADELARNPKVVSSIRRYEGRELVWFGEFTTRDGVVLQGGSLRTIGYRKAVRLIGQKIGLKSRGNAQRRKNERVAVARGGRSGCLLIVLAATLLAIFTVSARSIR
jgi:hypothetical protein